MIFAERYRQRRFREGREEGREVGREEAHQAWAAWNERRLQAEASGEPFNDPSPSQWQTNLDSNGKNS